MSARPSETPLIPENRAAAAPRVMRSEELFNGEREILIAHGGSHYRLRITRQGKLILTK